jgi:hypothetical protein
MKPQIVLPADVYDTLEFSSLAYGGIGAGSYTGGRDWAPLCVYGHASYADSGSEMWGALSAAGVGINQNDKAVGSKGRIPFGEWCKRLNVARGA